MNNTVTGVGSQPKSELGSILLLAIPWIMSFKELNMSMVTTPLLFDEIDQRFVFMSTSSTHMG